MRPLLILLFFAAACSARATSSVTWVNDSTNGFELKITGALTQNGGSYDMTGWWQNYLSPSGNWNILYSGSEVVSGPSNYQLNGASIFGDFLGDNAYSFSTLGSYISDIRNLPDSTGNIIKTYDENLPSFSGICLTNFYGTDLRDPSSWGYCIDIKVQGAPVAVPETGSSLMMLTIAIAGIFCARRMQIIK